MGNFFHLWPVLLFLAFMLGVSFWVQRASRGDRQQNFAKDYFIGGRSLGGFVLAMTTVATYSSVSTFVGGPGMAWAIGYGWLYMAIVQVVVIFLVLGIFGKKIAMVSRKIDAVTVVDVIRSRLSIRFACQYFRAGDRCLLLCDDGRPVRGSCQAL